MVYSLIGTLLAHRRTDNQGPTIQSGFIKFGDSTLHEYNCFRLKSSHDSIDKNLIFNEKYKSIMTMS